RENGDVSTLRPEDPGVRALFQQLILDHYRKPRNRGTLPDAAREVRVNNPLCGDEITLQLDVEAGSITGIRFTGHGCSISQASASMMTELVAGQSRSGSGELAQLFRRMLHGEESAASDAKLGDARALAGVAR